MTAPSGSPAAQPASPPDPRPGAGAAENCAYVRRLLRSKQPGFSVALELAVILAEDALETRRPGNVNGS
jgi:hypothetical protein